MPWAELLPWNKARTLELGQKRKLIFLTCPTCTERLGCPHLTPAAAKHGVRAGLRADNQHTNPACGGVGELPTGSWALLASLPPPETGQVPQHKLWAGRWRWMCCILHGNLLRDFPLLWHICKLPMKHIRRFQLCLCTHQPIPSCCPSKALHPLGEGASPGGDYGDTPLHGALLPCLDLGHHTKYRQSCCVSSCYLKGIHLQHW